MAGGVEKSLMKFYKSQSSDYSQLRNDTEEGNESEDEEVFSMYVTNEKKGEPNANYMKLERKEDWGRTKDRQGSYRIKTKKSSTCCSFSSLCILVLCTIFIIVTISTLSGILTKKDVKNAMEISKDLSIQKKILPPKQFITKGIWSSNYKNFVTEAPIRFVDVNEDGIDDIITGFGTILDGRGGNPQILPDGNRPFFGGAFALDGKSGSELWMHYTAHEVFAINCNGDLTQDGIADCLLGGRGGVFLAINGKNGSLIWIFSNNELHNKGMNFYTAQFIRDLDGDGILDVLQIHGGDINAKPYSKSRLSGKIIIVSGKNGKMLTWSETPDKKESYFSPLVYTVGNGTEMVIFGTGGETHGGSLYVMPLKDLYEGRIEKAVSIYKDADKGIMNPPILVDLTGDGTRDLLIAFFNSTYAAINGESFKIIWTYHIPNSETYSVPSPGYYNNDSVVDVMIRGNVGTGFPVYYHSLVTILDGQKGVPITKPFKTSVGMHSSPLSIGFQGYGNDAFLYWTVDCVGHEGEGGEYGMLLSNGIRIDTCSLRYKTKEINKLHITTNLVGFPGIDLPDLMLRPAEIVAEPTMRHKCKGKCPRHMNNAYSSKRGQKISYVQRIIGTGGLTKPLENSVDGNGNMESIDVVFATFSLETSPDAGITKEELHCIRRQYEIRKKQLPKHLVFQRNEKAVRKCLQKKPQIPENSKKNQRSEMTIYRIKIKPICQVRSQNQTCAKILPMVSQEWGGYMGSLTNGYFSGKRPAKRRP